MSISPALKSALKTTVLILGASGVIGIGWIGMVQILRVDAFAKFESGDGPLGEEVGVHMTNVHMKAYELGQLSAVADMGDLSIRRDRSQMTMTSVRNGEFISRDGVIYHFEGDRAVLLYFTRNLRADQGAHVWNDDVDLIASAFTFNDATKTLLVSGDVSGRLDDGDVTARDITIHIDTEEITAHDFSWSGMLQDPVQEDQRQEWTVFGKKFYTIDEDIRAFEMGRATDGEILIVADHIEHNRKTDVTIATGNVKFWGLDANVKCEKATLYRDERRIYLEGNVTMFIKTEDDEELREEEIPDLTRADPAKIETDPQGATDEEVEVLRNDENLRKYPTKVIADNIEYWYRKGERRAVITGSPFARQDLPEGWRLGWSVTGYYDGEAKTLTLKSTVEEESVREVLFFLSIGDIFKANDITFSTDEDNKNWSGNWVAAAIYIDEDDDGGGSTGGGTGGGTGG